MASSLAFDPGSGSVTTSLTSNSRALRAKKHTFSGDMDRLGAVMIIKSPPRKRPAIRPYRFPARRFEPCQTGPFLRNICLTPEQPSPAVLQGTEARNEGACNGGLQLPTCGLHFQDASERRIDMLSLLAGACRRHDRAGGARGRRR